MKIFLSTQFLQVKEWLAWKISTSSPPPANTSFVWTWKTLIHAIMLSMIISRWCNTFRTMQTGFLTPSPHPIHETWWLWWWPWWSCKQWWPWFFYRLGREMVTYLVYPGSTTGSPLLATLFLTRPWRVGLFDFGSGLTKNLGFRVRVQVFGILWSKG